MGESECQEKLKNNVKDIITDIADRAGIKSEIEKNVKSGEILKAHPDTIGMEFKEIIEEDTTKCN